MSARESAAAVLRSGGIVLFAGLAALVIFLGILPSSPGVQGASATSIQPEGRRAAFELLGLDAVRAAHGWPAPEAWREPPAALPSGRVLLVLPARPPNLDDDEEAFAGLGDARDPRHYRRFLESGGTILCAWGDAERAFFVETLKIEAAAALSCEDDGAGGARFNRRLVLPDGERLRVRIDSARVFAQHARNSALETLAQTDDEREFAVAVQVGRGRLVALADDGFLSNERIGDADDALLFVRLLEALPRPERILFDEYVLGGWAPPSKLALALGPRLRALTLQLVVLALVLVWSALVPRPFPRDPLPDAQQNALARAEGLAGTLAASGAWARLGVFLRAGVGRRLARRVGVPPAPGGEPDLEALVAALEAGASEAPAGRTLTARALFLGASPTSALDLGALGRDLAALERTLLDQGRRRGDRPDRWTSRTFAHRSLG